MATIKSRWENLLAFALRHGLPPDEAEGMRRAFYAGAFEMNLLIRDSFKPALTDEESMAMWEGWAKELYIDGPGAAMAAGEETDMLLQKLTGGKNGA